MACEATLTSPETLDIEKITHIRERAQSFKDLVLPKQHKKLVESLVETHYRGSKPVKGAKGAKSVNETERQDDLVRGKGKGLIILLVRTQSLNYTLTDAD